ncbi:MAG TPA: alpha/beta fold hydrolase [Pseudolabrys sp.]|nr:alpha/beta fold hydrolase [Pseudolabrys sp.]
MTILADIAYLRREGRGGGLPLVLLHGIGSNAQSFAPLMTALPPAIDAIAWNAPGYAGSAPLVEASPAPAHYADALLTLIDALALERIALVGHSLGCLFAANFAARYPARVAAVALMSPALGYQVAPGAALPTTVQARIDEIAALGPQAFAEKRAARLVHAPERKPQVLAAVRDAMAAVNPPGYVQAVRALGAGDLVADAARIAAPTLVAVGANDVVTPPANARIAYAALAHPAGYHETPDAGHALPQEQPDAVAALLMQLVEPCHV